MHKYSPSVVVIERGSLVKKKTGSAVVAGEAVEDTLNIRHVLKVADLSTADIITIIRKARYWKLQEGQTSDLRPLEGKTLGMIFSKPSTRTRVSFQAAVCQLGGQAINLSMNDLQLGRGESIADTARVLSRYLDGILIRTFSQGDVEEFAAFSTMPVINGLTDETHPTQALADLMTIQEKLGRWQGIKLAYVGDGNNVAHSLMMAAAKVGMDFAIATPPGYEPEAAVVNAAREVAASMGSVIEVGYDPEAACRGAQAVYTDVWVSMGQDGEKDARLEAFKDYQVNDELMSLASEEAIFLHCLPAHRGEEVSASVIDGPQSAVFDQAENRMHIYKGILSLII